MNWSHTRRVLIVLMLSISAGTALGCGVRGDRPAAPNPESTESASPPLSRPEPIESPDPASSSPSLPSSQTPSPSAPESHGISEATTTSESPDPTEPEAISLTCSGRIQDGPDFTAYYTSDKGFSRLEFGPPERIVVSELIFGERNDQGQDIWRGSAFGQADVSLIALSTESIQDGDEVSVKYDTRWGRAICVAGQS